jgi:hypothetical protein
LVKIEADQAQQQAVEALTREQDIELDAYMERAKVEYLQKILEQVNQQNIEYFENLACEYTIQMDFLLRKLSNPNLKLEINCNFGQPDAPIDFLGGPDDALPSFLCKKEILKMHLEILYKSIGFLCEDKIFSKLETYKL